LIGQGIEFQGHKLDGSPFDAAACQGRVVLVGFWAAWCRHCLPEITNTRRNYQLYHDRGFEVVAVSLDQDRQRLEQFLRGNSASWAVLHTDGAGWNHPMALHYGIAAIPTMFLAGRDGKVLSTDVRGRELDRLLERCLGPPYVPQGKLSYIDLAPKANQVWTEVPQGERAFGGVKFQIGESVIQIGSQVAQERPREVKGIQIDRRFAVLYALHSTIFSAGAAGNVPDRALIGRYVVNYSDGTKATVPIVYGEDLRDWWNIDQSKPVSRGTVAWEGSNPEVKSRNLTLRLYLTRWANPRPEKQVATIDYVSTNTVSAPFCAAMTVEERCGEQSKTASTPRGEKPTPIR
jgi:peroxiredoxin